MQCELQTVFAICSTIKADPYKEIHCRWPEKQMISRRHQPHNSEYTAKTTTFERLHRLLVDSVLQKIPRYIYHLRMNLSNGSLAIQAVFIDTGLTVGALAQWSSGKKQAEEPLQPQKIHGAIETASLLVFSYS